MRPSAWCRVLHSSHVYHGCDVTLKSNVMLVPADGGDPSLGRASTAAADFLQRWTACVVALLKVSGSSVGLLASSPS